MRTGLIFVVGIFLIFGVATKAAVATPISQIFQSYCGNNCFGVNVFGGVDTINPNTHPNFNEGGSGSTYAFGSAAGGGVGASAIADLLGNRLYVAAGIPHVTGLSGPPYVSGVADTFAAAVMWDTLYIQGATAGSFLDLFLSLGYAFGNDGSGNYSYVHVDEPSGGGATLVGALNGQGSVLTEISYTSCYSCINTTIPSRPVGNYTQVIGDTGPLIYRNGTFGEDNIELIFPLLTGDNVLYYQAVVGGGNGALIDPSIYINAPQGVSILAASGANYPTFNPINIAATPEPPTFWLMATGILGMVGWFGYRRIRV